MNSMAQHWQNGALDALRVAKLCVENNQYELALFHCHLCIEKSLKSFVYTAE